MTQAATVTPRFQHISTQPVLHKEAPTSPSVQTHVSSSLPLSSVYHPEWLLTARLSASLDVEVLSAVSTAHHSSAWSLAQGLA